MGYDAIVIGAGLGGCSAAAVMADAGMKVLILERMPQVGGRCSSVTRDGFTLDTGAHAIFGCEHGAIEEACRMVGKDGVIKWHHFRKMVAALVDTRVTFDGKKFMIERVGEDPIVFHARALVKNMLKEVPDHLVTMTEGLMGRIVPWAADIVGPIAENYNDVRVVDFIDKFIDWPRIEDLIDVFQCGMFGSPSSMTSTAEVMRTIFGLMSYVQPGVDPMDLAGFPIGGLIRIPATICEGIEEKGGEVRTRANVKRIVIENGNTAGVELDDGEIINAPVVVSNAGLKETVADLAGREHFEPEYADRIRDLKTGTSGFCLRAALDTQVTDVDMGGIMMLEVGGAEEYFRELWEDLTIPDALPPIYFGVPSNMDPSLAPPGKQLIVGIGCLMFDSKDPYSKMEELTLDAFDKALPGFMEHLVWYDFLDPGAYSAFGERLAPAIGLAQCVGQVGEDRPSSILPVEGLYACGGEAGANISGMACDLCVKSGLACGEHIVRNSNVG